MMIEGMAGYWLRNLSPYNDMFRIRSVLANDTRADWNFGCRWVRAHFLANHNFSLHVKLLSYLSVCCNLMSYLGQELICFVDLSRWLRKNISLILIFQFHFRLVISPIFLSFYLWRLSHRQDWYSSSINGLTVGFLFSILTFQFKWKFHLYLLFLALSKLISYLILIFFFESVLLLQHLTNLVSASAQHMKCWIEESLTQAF